MNGTRGLIAAIAAAMLLALAVAGCAQQPPTAVEPVQEQIQEQSEQDQASVDEALNAAQAAVTEYVSLGDGLETRVNGLQLKSDLQEIQRKVTNAIEQTGDAKVAALDELSSAFSNLIARVETAAGEAPAGGAIQTELNDFAQKLKDTQASLAAAAAASNEASSAPTP